MADLDVGLLDRVAGLVRDARRPGAVGLVVVTADEAQGLLDAILGAHGETIEACVGVLNLMCGEGVEGDG